MLPLIGSIIGAGASLIGGAMSSNAQKKANQANIAAQEAANQKNYEAQKEFAQQGLRWKVEDAKAAGIHPLYAVGAPAQSFSASFAAPQIGADTSMGNAMASAGQDIGRAVSATLTPTERAYNQTVQQLGLERASLENELLRTQIRRQLVETGPGFPSATTGANGLGGVTSVNVGGNRVDADPGWSDAQKFEDRYGELVSLPAGLGIAIADLVKNVQNKWAVDFDDYAARTRDQQSQNMHGRPAFRTGGSF